MGVSERMDNIDLDVLRWMYPGGVWSPWGSDPRITVADIASHIGLNRTAVWARLRKWRRNGAWNGFETHVNLRIFGVGVLLASFHVVDSAEGWDLLDRAGEIEGVVGASLHFGDSMVARDVEHVAVIMVGDAPANVHRRMRALRRLSPTGVVDGPVVIEPPSTSRELTELDWRILAAMLANPNASAPRLARLIGVSPKTLEHHRSALIDDHVVSSAPKFNWSQMGCIPLGFLCHNAADVDAARKAVEDRIPHSIPASHAGLNAIVPGYEPSKFFSFIVPIHSPHGVQTLVRDLSRIPGVKMVRPELWGPQRAFPTWVERRIAQHFASVGGVVRPIAMSARGPNARVLRAPIREDRSVLATP
jgi:DNA-binding Lrp family transcriptional regulator